MGYNYNSPIPVVAPLPLRAQSTNEGKATSTTAAPRDLIKLVNIRQGLEGLQRAYKERRNIWTWICKNVAPTNA